jgi:hypothetical protein
LSTSPADSRALRALLTDAARYDAEYRGGLSNHLPMALTALARLGADDERLAEFAQRYAQRLHPAAPREPWAAARPWRERFGDPQAWPTYRTLFRQWIVYEGVPETLAQVLPPLMQGVAAAAFHGPIRVAYALAANHADELADALAYWACRWFTCGTPRQGGSEREPARVLARLDFAHELPPQPLIAQAIAAAAAHPRFDAALAPLHVNLHTTLPRLAQIAAERYAAGADFTVLHLVTSAHAVAVLLPWIDEPQRLPALALYARAAAAAWATCKPRDPLPPLAVLPWPEIVARAIASDDDHVIKLVDSCRAHEQASGGAAWAAAASRAVCA